MIYAAHSRLISSPQKSDGSGIFEHDGFMGRYSRFIENLDSSFCAIKYRPPVAQPAARSSQVDPYKAQSNFLTTVRRQKLQKLSM